MNVRGKSYVGALAALALSLFTSHALAQDPVVPVLSLDPDSAPVAAPAVAAPAMLTADDAPAALMGPEGDAWWFDLDLYAWFPSLNNGHLGVDHHDVAINESFIDILRDSDSLIGLSGRVEVGKGKWTLYADGNYMRIGKNDVGATATGGQYFADVRLDLALATFGVYYRVGDWDVGGNKLMLEVGPSGRNTFASLHIDGRGLTNTNDDADKDWIDAVAAFQVKYQVDRHWQLTGRADIGAGMSDYTWMAAAFAAYRFKLNDKLDAGIRFGYQAIGDKYVDGGFLYQSILHGPVLDFDIDF